MFNKSKNVYNYLIKNGINKYHAFGLLGNIAMESGFNHNASNGSYWGYVLNSKKIKPFPLRRPMAWNRKKINKIKDIISKI